MQLNTQIVINATPAQVWNVFSNFSTYKDWNPFLKSVEGDVQEGNTITINAGGMTFKPKVLEWVPQKKLVWIGRLGFPGIFDGAHSFELKNNGDGTTTFIQNEEFKGILIPLFKKKLKTDTKDGFIAMNEALKELVELHGKG